MSQRKCFPKRETKNIEKEFNEPETVFNFYTAHAIG